MVESRLCRTNAQSANNPELLTSASVAGGLILSTNCISTTHDLALAGSGRGSLITLARATMADSPWL